MRLIQTIPFSVNTVGTFSERFPALKNGMYTSQLYIDSAKYTLTIFPNFYSENVEISIKDEVGDYKVQNLPFNISRETNYLIGSSDFSNFKLIYNIDSNQFELLERG